MVFVGFPTGVRVCGKNDLMAWGSGDVSRGFVAADGKRGEGSGINHGQNKSDGGNA